MLSCSFSSICDLVDIPNDEQKINQRRMEKEKEQLVQINTDLSNQVSSYRKKLDETLNITSTYDSILMQNSEKSKEIAKLRLEIHDLQNRLNISMSNNQELKRLLEAQKCDVEGRFIIESEEKLNQQNQKYQNIINQMKIDHSNEITNLKNEINFYLKYKEALESLFDTAGSFFNIEINSPNSLIQCIKNFSKANHTKCNRQSSQINCKLQKQQKLIDCYQKSETNHQKQIDEINSRHKLEILTLNQQIDDLQYRNKLLTNQNEDLTINNEKLNSELTKQSALAKLAQFEKETGSICPNGSTCQNAFEITKQILNLTNELKSLKKQNRLLQKKLSDSILKCKKYEIKYKELTTNNEEMEKTYQNRSKDLSKRTQQIIEKESKTREMETSYLRYKNEVSVKDQEIQAMKENISMINQDLKCQLSKYTDLMKEKDQLFHSLQEQKSNNEIINSRLKMEEDKRKEAESRLRCIQQKICANGTVDPNCFNNESVPPCIFASSEFPRELQCVLREVGESTSCSLTMKLSNAFSIIAKWYRSRYDKLESECNGEKQNLTILHSQVDYLLNTLRSMFPEVKINFDLLLTDEATRSILSDAVSKIHECEAKKAKKRIETQLSELYETLNVKELIELKEEVFQLIKKFEASKKKLKEIRRISKEKEKELEKALKNVNNQYDNVSKTCVILENSKTDLQSQIFELEKEKEKIRKQIELNSKAEIDRIREDFEKKIDLMLKEENDLKKQVQALLEANENLEVENGNLNELLKKMRSKKDRLEKDIKFNEENSKQMKEKWKNDKFELQKRYESLVNQTKSSTIELQEKIKELMIKISKYEDEIASLKNNIVEMTLKIKKTETQMAAVRSETDRDKKSLQSQLNAQLVSLQNEYKRQLEEKQFQFDAERRKIAEALSRNFSALTDGMKIDINSIESAANVIKKKVDDAFRRETNLRRSLNSNYDTTSDEGYGYNLSIHRKKVTSTRY